MIAFRARQDMIERSAAADRTLAVLAQEPMEKAERNDPTQPMERTEPTDPTDRTDPRDAIDRIESVDRIDSTEPLQARRGIAMDELY